MNYTFTNRSVIDTFIYDAYSGCMSIALFLGLTTLYICMMVFAYKLNYSLCFSYIEQRPINVIASINYALDHALETHRYIERLPQLIYYHILHRYNNFYFANFRLYIISLTYRFFASVLNYFVLKFMNFYVYVMIKHVRRKFLTRDVSGPKDRILELRGHDYDAVLQSFDYDHLNSLIKVNLAIDKCCLIENKLVKQIAFYYNRSITPSNIYTFLDSTIGPRARSGIASTINEVPTSSLSRAYITNTISRCHFIPTSGKQSVLQMLSHDIFGSDETKNYYPTLGNMPVDLIAAFCCNLSYASLSHKKRRTKAQLTVIYLFLSQRVQSMSDEHDMSIMRATISTLNSLLRSSMNSLSQERHYINTMNSFDLEHSLNNPEISYTPTSFKKKAIKFLDMFDELLLKPQHIMKTLTGEHIKKIFTFICYSAVFPAAFIKTAKFLSLYDRHFADDLTELNVDTIVSLLQSMSSLSRKLIGDESHVFSYSTDPVSFIKDVEWLDRYRYNRCHPSELAKHPNRVSNADWIAKVNECWVRRLSIDTRGSYSSVNSLLTSTNSILRSLHDEALNNEGVTRNKPFVIGLCGDSQAGKTTFIAPSLSQIVLNVLGYETKNINDGFTILNSADKFLSGYDQNIHHSVLFDEVGAYVMDGTSPNVFNTSLLEMLSGGVLKLNSAHLHEKGKREFRPDCVFIASNFDDFGFPVIVNHVEAAYNRVDVKISVRIRNEFKRLVENTTNPAGGMDSDIIKEHQSNLLLEYGEAARGMNDFYPVEFILYKKVNANFVPLPERIGFIDLCQYIKQQAIIHKDRVHGDSDLKTTNMLDVLNSIPVDLAPTSGPTVTHFNNTMLLHIPLPGFWYMMKIYITYFALSFLLFLFRIFPTYFEDKINDLISKQVQIDLEKAIWRSIVVSKQKINIIREEVKNLVVEKVKDKVIKYSIVSITAVATLIYLIKRMTSDEEQSPTSGVKFEARSDLPPNNILGRIPGRFHGVNNIYGCSDDQPLYPSASSAPKIVLEDKLKRNIWHISVNDDACHALNVHDCFYIIPYHFAQLIKSDAEVIMYQYIYSPEGNDIVGTCNEVLRLSGNAIEIYKISTDTSVMKIVHCQPGPSLLNYFMKDFGNVKQFSGTNLYFNNPDGFVNDPFNGQLQSTKYRRSLNPNAQITDELAIAGKTETPSFDGRCGSPLYCMFNKQLCLVGINVAGQVGKNINAFDYVTRGDLESGINALKNASNILVPTSTIPIQDSFVLSKFAGTFGQATRNNHCYWLSSENVKGIRFQAVLQEIAVARPKSKTFKLTTFKSFFEHFPLEYHHSLIAPDFRDYFDTNGNYCSVYGNMLSQVSTQAHNVNAHHLNLIVGYLTNKFSQIEEFKHLEFWDLEHSTSGASYNPYCRALPKTTGAGFPFNCKKKDLFTDADSKYAPDGMKPGYELTTRVNSLIELMKTGERPMFVYKTCMKDEPRDAQKVASRSIRVFTCASVDSVIIQKMFFGSFTGIFCANFLETETVGGLNCYSKDWGRVFDKLKRHPNCINGDYSKYDKKASPALISAAFSIMVNVIDNLLHIDHETRELMRVMMSEICHPLLLIDKELLQFNGSLSSGIYLTFILNNIMNSIYIRLAWLDIIDLPPIDSLQEFDAHVVFFAMGDDNTFTVSDKYINKFNFATIQKYFARIGIKYTNAAKTDEIYGHVPVSEATICKRRFVYSQSLKHCLCPLEKPSIGKMLTMALDSGPLTEEQKIKASCSSAIYEFFQYGKKEYDLNIERMRKTLLAVNIRLANYPTFEEMRKRILLNDENPWSDTLFEDLIDIVIEPLIRRSTEPSIKT